MYVHKQSNHPPGILKNIPHAVNTRLSSISANEEVFNNAIPLYQEALEKSGYDFKLKFSPPDQNKKKKSKNKRKITYFNPPFSLNVQTNIGGKFLQLIDKHFPPSHPLSKIINRNTVKISYRCMPNMKAIITGHNFKIQKSEEETPTFGCNCTGRCGPCPLGGRCQVDSVVYKATVTTDNNVTNTYTGLTSDTFKKRWYKHRETFEKQDHSNPTTLSTYIWDLKLRNKNHDIKWSIIERAKDFNPITRKCRLCLKEKYHIIYNKEGATLNERSELFSTCRHRKRLTPEKL